MKVIALFLFAIFCGSALGAVGTVFTIDDFVVDSPAIVIVIPSQPSFPITSANFVSDSTILGGERDLDLTATSGGANLVLSAGVSAGSFNSAAPKGANGVSLLQYDGVDHSMDLNPSGLFSYYYNDFTFDNGYALRTNISADIPTNVFFRVYSGSQTSYCEYLQPIPGNGLAALYVLNYSAFNRSGNGCDFTNVGAFEIEVDLSQNVDIDIDVIEVVAVLSSSSPTRSRTPSSLPTRTRTPTPSRIPASNTRTPTASRSVSRAPRSPSMTPTPSSCICTCPELECFMFQYGTFTFNGHRNGRNVDMIDEFAAVDQQEVVNEEGFDFLKFF